MLRAVDQGPDQPVRRPVVVLFDAYPQRYRGAQRTLHAMARALPSAGWDARVFVPGGGELADRLDAEGLDVTVVGLSEDALGYGRRWRSRPLKTAAALPAYWVRLSRAIRQVRPALVHVNDHRGLVLAGPAARLAGVPLVWHIHAVAGGRLINEIGRRLAVAVVVPSKAALRASAGIGAHAAVIPETFALEPAEGREPEDGTVVCLARLHPDKGVDVLLRAARLLRERSLEVRVLIAGEMQAGEDDYAALLEQLAREAGPSVELLGPVEDAVPLLRRAVLYVQPSRPVSETFGMGLIEAMAMGIPPVASNIDCFAENVEHGKTGLLVPVDDPEALADAIGRVIGDPRYADALGAEAKRTVRERFSADAALRRLVTLYAEVADGAAPG